MKTVFILGAGASCDFGYPTGNGLVRELKESLVENHNLYQSLKLSQNGEHNLKILADRLHYGRFDTIDELLVEWSTDHDLRELSRRAVGYHIRMRENESRLFPLTAEEPHWYDSLLAHLKRNKAQIAPHSFSFVTFNYDRSFRYYFYQALSQLNGGRESAREFLSDNNVLHVHGHIGDLPWQYPDDLSKPAHALYGATLAIEDYRKFNPSIQFPDDKREQNRRIKQLLEGADCIVFLGFGFHRSNLDILEITRLNEVRNKLFFATTYKLKQEGELNLNNIPRVRKMNAEIGAFMSNFLSAHQRGELAAFRRVDGK